MLGGINIAGLCCCPATVGSNSFWRSILVFVTLRFHKNFVMWMSYWRHTTALNFESVIWQLIQNLAPSTIVWRQCDIRIQVLVSVFKIFNIYEIFRKNSNAGKSVYFFRKHFNPLLSAQEIFLLLHGGILEWNLYDLAVFARGQKWVLLSS